MGRRPQGAIRSQAAAVCRAVGACRPVRSLSAWSAHARSISSPSGTEAPRACARGDEHEIAGGGGVGDRNGPGGDIGQPLVEGAAAGHSIKILTPMSKDQ